MSNEVTWTPGPLAIDRDAAWGHYYASAPGLPRFIQIGGKSYAEAYANAQLVAIMGEMAEAILAWSAQRCDCNIVPGPPEDSYICPRCDSMGGIAAKLRAIGASDA